MDRPMTAQQDDGAPIVQLLLTVGFAQPISDLSLIDLADIARLFTDDLPVFQQVNRASPMPPGLDDQQALQALYLPAMGLPRLSLTTTDRRDQLLFQDDRLSFGWMRTTPLGAPHDYPGFRETYARFSGYLNALAEWVASKQLPVLPAVGEAVYTDAFEVGDRSVLADIFSPLNPDSKLPMNNLQYSFQQRWPDDRTGHIAGTFGGPQLSPDGMFIMTLETTGRFALLEGFDAMASEFTEAHQLMRNTFECLVKPAARAKLAV